MYNYSTKRHSLGKEGNRACYGLLKQSRRHVHCSTRGCITKWTGHVMRMEDSRLPKQIFCSELARDTRKRYRDSLKNSQRACDIYVKGWEHLAADRSAWSRQPTTEPKPSRKGDCHSYWAIQAGLLTPLTFARHRLSPLAAFTSGAYFLHNGRQ